MNDDSSFIHHRQKLDQTSFNGCANKLQHIHAMEYYLAIKKTNINTGNSLDGSPKNYTEFKKKKKSQSPKITYLQF